MLLSIKNYAGILGTISLSGGQNIANLQSLLAKCTVASFVTFAGYLIMQMQCLSLLIGSYRKVREHTDCTLGAHTTITESFYTKLDLTPTNIPTKQHN